MPIPGPIDISNPVVRSDPLNRGLAEWWLGLPQLSGGAKFRGLVGGNHGTLTNGATWKPTTRTGGHAHVQLDGVDDHIIIPNSPSLQLGDVDFTLTTWVQMTSKPGGSLVIALKGTGGGGGQYDVQLFWGSFDDRFRVFFSSAGGAESGGTSSAAVAPAIGVWYFLRAWHDATANQVGLQVDEGTPDTWSHTAGLVGAATSLYLGGVVGGTQPFPGLLDDVRYYRRVLTAAEHGRLYRIGPRGYPGVLRRLAPRPVAYVADVGGGAVIAPLAGALYRRRRAG